VLFVNAILNLSWAAVCLAAFAWLIAFEKRRERGSLRSITYRAIALSLALVSLFPCVSASDDSVRLQFFDTSSDLAGASATPHDSGSPEKAPPSGEQSDKKALGTLVRMLEALDSVQITVSLALYIVLCLFAVAQVEKHRSLDRFLPARAGRAPPVLNPRLIPV
jgi:hypothetical protein